MLPPVDPRILERNPNFDVLYKDLTTRKLNPDGSTRDTKKQRIHDEIRRVSINHYIPHLHVLKRATKDLRSASTAFVDSLLTFSIIIINDLPLRLRIMRYYMHRQPLEITSPTSAILNILTHLQSLTNARTSFISSQILIQSLDDLPSRSPDLPPELQSVLEIVIAQLNGHIPDSDREILSGEIDLFLENITTISTALSSQLSIIVEHLCKIADPKSPPAISQLATSASSLHRTATQDLPHDLSAAQIHLTNTCTTLLTTHLTLLTTSIRILEQTQHGALARHTKSSAELLHMRATVLGLQAKMHAIAHAPPAEFVGALKEYRKAQGSGEKALRDREALARQGLELYEKAGEKGMRDLAKRKGWLESEIVGVEGEIEKLNNGGS
jgi:hypothetical protein